MKGRVTGKIVEWELGETMDEMTDNLGPWDYAVFAILLLFSCVIGFYFAWKDKNTTDLNNYALGGRTLSSLPVAISLAATGLSAITMIGTPAEYYYYGSTFAYSIIADVAACIVAMTIYIPMYYTLGITSIYEYIQLRFGFIARVLMTVLYIIQSVLYNSLVVYSPALAVNQVAGLDINIGILVIGCVCILYTSLGGMKAVVWTDVFQVIWMVSGFLIIIVVAAVDFDGYSNIWNIAVKGNRMEPQFEVDPRFRHTFWTLVIGCCTGGTMCSFNFQQFKIQRYLSCKSLKAAQKSVLYSIPLTTAVCIMAMLVGWSAYAYFEHCDPWRKNWVSEQDQIIPYLALYMFAIIGPGISGIYISAVFGASLSTTSSSINSCSVVLIEDIIKPIFKINNSIIPVLSKVMMVTVGAMIIAFAYLARNMQGMIQACFSINGLMGGPVIAVFTMGAFMPYIGEIPILFGTVCGLAIPIWINLGANKFPPGPEWTRPRELDTSSCTGSNATLNSFQTSDCEFTQRSYETSTGIFGLYHMSYSYLGTIGLLTSLVVTHIVALIQNKIYTNAFFTPCSVPRAGTTYYTKFAENSYESIRRKNTKELNQTLTKL